MAGQQGQHSRRGTQWLRHEDQDDPHRARLRTRFLSALDRTILDSSRLVTEVAAPSFEALAVHLETDIQAHANDDMPWSLRDLLGWTPPTPDLRSRVPETDGEGVPAEDLAEIGAGLRADGRARFYDINALSNFVTDAPNVIGFDPFAKLADWLEREANLVPTGTAGRSA